MKIGKVPENVLKRSVLRQIQTKREEIATGAGVGVDCACFSFCGGETAGLCMQTAAVGTDKDLVSGAKAPPGLDSEPVISPGQLIQRCANNLAAAGTSPIGVMIALTLPEEADETALKELMKDAEAKCRELDVQIAGGQTRVSGAVRHPVAVVTGYGRPFAGAKGSAEICGGKDGGANLAKKPYTGQDIVISKWVGLEGTAILARQYRDRLLERYPAYFVDEAAGFTGFLSVIPEAATAVKSGVSLMHDASEGGIFGALWELAERAGAGLTIDLKKIPLRQETVEVCECCNANPYELLSGGALLMVTEDGPGLAAALEAEGIPAAVAGRLTAGKDRIIVNREETRFLDRPKNDEIYRQHTAFAGDLKL